MLNAGCVARISNNLAPHEGAPKQEELSDAKLQLCHGP